MSLYLEEMELYDLHQAFKKAKKKSARDAYKINVIILLPAGWQIEAISAALLISDETIRQYKNAYLSGGIKKLLRTKYVGSNSKLTEHERSMLCEELNSAIYLTTNQVIAYVKREFKA